MNAMSISHKGCMNWARNRDWYYIDDERDRFVLTPAAPKEVGESFEKYKKINNLDRDD